MMKHIERKLITINTIDEGNRLRQPSNQEVDKMVDSIERYGLLNAIGVGIGGGKVCLLYGATRLSATKKLDWKEIPAEVWEGTPQDFASAELVENLERRHLDKDQLAQLTNELYELRTKEIEKQKELNDNLSRNSSPQSKGHAKAKVEGAKRGRPPTPEGQLKKELAATTGQSVRAVQKATSNKPKGDPAPKKSADRDQIGRHIQKITELLSDCDRGDRDTIRESFTPLLDGWFGEDGKLRGTDDNPVARAELELPPGDPKDQANCEYGQLEADAENPVSPMNLPTGEAALAPVVGAEA